MRRKAEVGAMPRLQGERRCEARREGLRCTMPQSAATTVEPAQPTTPERVQQITPVLVAEMVQRPSAADRAEETAHAGC